MSDPATPGGPSEAAAATTGSASSAASSGHPAPIGSFGTAKGSGLLRGKRPSAPTATATSAPAPSGYQPTALEVMRPQSEYKNPFTGETSVPTVTVNEPAPQAASPAPAPMLAAPAATDFSAKASAMTEVFPKDDAPVPTAAPVAAVTPSVRPTDSAKEDLFPFSPTASTERKQAPTPTAKVALNILPTEEVKRPAVSWGESAPNQNDESRSRRDERPTFRPERREPRPFEPREPRRNQPAGERQDRPSSPRETAPRDFTRDQRPAPPAVAPAKKSGGFFGWLKSLFAEKPAVPEVRTGERGDRDDHGRDGGHQQNRRRHRGGRGRGQGGFNGENRGPREQPRDPRDEAGPSNDGGENRGEHRGEQHGEHPHEGGGGRRRHRGGRGRNRDERGPRPEGQQGGGAI